MDAKGPKKASGSKDSHVEVAAQLSHDDMIPASLSRPVQGDKLTHALMSTTKRSQREERA